jgi:hypothetical protein
MIAPREVAEGLLAESMAQQIDITAFEGLVKGKFPGRPGFANYRDGC